MASMMLTTLIGFISLAAICHGQQLLVKHAPSYVVFQQQTPENAVSSSDLHNILSGPLGLSSQKNSPIQSKSVLKRPKANVLITVITHQDQQEIPMEALAKFPLNWDSPNVDVEQLMNNLQGRFLEKDPVMLDLVSSNQFFDVKTSSDLFQSLPSSFAAAKDRLLDADSILKAFGGLAASLNASHSTDGGLFAEMQMMGDVVDKLKQNSDRLATGTPDLLSFTLTGLKSIGQKYGLDSAQAKEAQDVLTQHLDKMTEDLKSIYRDNVMVEVLTVPHSEKPLVRKTRSLKATDTGIDYATLNLAIDYQDDFPVTFNIVLWLMLVLIITIIFIAYGIWNMNPNLESILYRVPQDESKKLN